MSAFGVGRGRIAPAVQTRAAGWLPGTLPSRHIMSQEERMPQKSVSSEGHALAVRGDRVVLGEWSGDLDELIARSVQLRGLLTEGRLAEARALVQGREAGEQAALVAMDEDPEEVLSLTGMDDTGRPAYAPDVIDWLPTDTVTAVLVPRRAHWTRFNAELMRRISPGAFSRVVDETLDPVHYHGHRGRISWEWLEAVAALDDPVKAAELLFRVDPSVLAEALMDRLDHLAIQGDISAGSMGSIAVFRLFSDSGRAVALPPIEDPEVAEVIHALHQAAPELLARAVREAWERVGGGGS